MGTIHSTAGFSNHFDQWCDVLPKTNKENPNLGCQKHKETLVLCFQFDVRNPKQWTLPRYTKENGEQGGENIVKGLSKCAYARLFFFILFFYPLQSEWSAAVFFPPNPAPPVCVSFEKQSLSSVCFQCLEMLIFSLVILSYFYFTLPEKQSSSAVTWASPGCHVFLKGCLRGTLQMEPSLITCSICLCPFLFSLTSSSCRPQSSPWSAIYLITLLPLLPYCHVVVSLLLQLAVISLGADVES